MSHVRRVRLEYYRVVCRPKDQQHNIPDTRFDLQLWLDKVTPMTLPARTRDYHAEKARLDSCWFDEVRRLWFLSFVRLRDTNIPNKARADQEIEPLILDADEYIGEEAVALFDPDNFVLMLQRNRHSLSPQGIEQYLNLLWASDSESIYLRPIRPRNVVEKAQGATTYRRLTLRFADVDKIELNGNGRGPVRQLFDIFRQYRAVNGEITVTMGYEQGSSLSKETVTDSINDILDNQTLVSKAEVGMKETDDTKVEVVDLFADKLQDFISPRLGRRESLASEYIAQLMMEKYDESRTRILASLGGS